MKKLFIILTLLFVFVIDSGALFPGNRTSNKKKEKALLKQLSQKYRHWLDLVFYIITKEERSTFFKLTNDRDREIFVSLFWNLRDPSPGTKENEFKTEHIRRFQYANRYFKYGTPREGWKTDMGRIYIILGEPDSKDKYEMDTIVVPAQIWSFYGRKRPGLPNSFWIVFWKKHGIGEYKIYDPASDGPYSLIRKTSETANLDIGDNKAIYESIEKQHPQLAKASLTLLPDETHYDFNPTLLSQQLLMDVIEHPQKKINDTYATNFLKYKGKVEVDYSMNYIESKHYVAVMKNPGTGLNFINIALRPSTLSAATSGKDNNCSFNFVISVSLKKNDFPLFEYRKRFSFSGSKEEFREKFSNGLIISDCFPAIDGNFKLSVLLKNQVSKEFTFFDTNVSIGPGTHSKPVISGLLTSKEVKKLSRMTFHPFKYRDMEVTLDPGSMFGIKDNVYVIFNIERNNYGKGIKGVIEVRDFFDPGKYIKLYPFEIASGKKIESFSRELERMNPGYYRIYVRLLSTDGSLMDEKKDKFTISVADHIAGTTTISRTASFENRFLYFHILGLQYMRLNRLDEAGTFLEKAYRMRPHYPVYIKDFCFLLLKKKHFDRVLKIVENLKEGEKYQFDYYSLKGKALYQKGQYKEAVENLAKANRVYDSDISVLNVLGLSYLKTGNKAEAKKVFSASLRLNEHQKEIAAILKEID